MPYSDEKYCPHCEGFFLLGDEQLDGWHAAGHCTKKTIPVMIKLTGAAKYPAQVETLVNVQTDEEIPLRALQGYRVQEIFSDSIGRLVTIYAK